ncbi:hypothetical protein LPJ81_005888 [Coemansia sp. IMI 209127]|nr:hypothetical protein LPJ81_005888 [Coemansia sp. IMI 209127]
MTAEELLESLKLPPTGSMGTSSRPGSSYGSSPSPGGSLGRHSPLPLPRTSSFSDVGSRTLPSSTTTRFSSAVFSESPASDSTLMSNAFTTTSFNPKAEININLGLDNSTAQGTASSAASRRGANSGTGSRRLGNRRRSRSICVWERR